MIGSDPGFARSHPAPDRSALDAVGARVFERGWLSANNVLLTGDGPNALVDSGYCTHAAQTLSLVTHALEGRQLDLLLNTHLHSDHCGGNAALQAQYPPLQTHIPPGLAEAVSRWDTRALTYAPTGQQCPRFQFQALLRPGDSLQLGTCFWDVYGAKGHDPHAVVLFQPIHRVLISADALWHNGFGVVFPELEGVHAFDEVSETLDAIETLEPILVIPGHGPVFSDVTQALSRARSRLDQFVQSPDKHLRHAIKVLIKFRLLEWQKVSLADLWQWCEQTPYLHSAMPVASDEDQRAWFEGLLNDLAKVGALKQQGDWILNT